MFILPDKYFITIEKVENNEYELHYQEQFDVKMANYDEIFERTAMIVSKMSERGKVTDVVVDKKTGIFSFKLKADLHVIGNMMVSEFFLCSSISNMTLKEFYGNLVGNLLIKGSKVSDEESTAEGQKI